MSPQTKDTRSFVAFYINVTEAIEARISQGALSVQQSDFLRFLYFGFWKAYKPDWKQPPIAGILYRLKKAGGFDALPVACQAYLHMAYDLPRVIADALSTNPPIGLTPDGMDDTFSGMNDLFNSALTAQFRSFKAVGIFALPAIVLGKGFSLSNVAVVWVQLIRLQSFKNATRLDRLQAISPSTRTSVEIKLRDEVVAAIDGVLKHKLNPALWFTILRSPSIVMTSIALPPLFLLLDSSDLLSPHRVLAAKIAGVVLLSYGVAAYWGLMRLVADAGSSVALAAERVMEEAERSLLNETTSPRK